MVRALADWWDAVELWLTQLSFVFQVLIAIVVVVPLCWAVAVGIDKAVDRAVALVAARMAGRRAGRER